MTTIQYSRPKNISKYENLYILFHGDDPNPKVLFSSAFPEDAYAEAQKLAKKSGKMPIMERVTAKDSNFF
ncbi:MAG: hypothetical protein WC843_05190 [Candidatus Gracilibacteria bacterium]|jgi:hypothetical protein